MFSHRKHNLRNNAMRNQKIVALWRKGKKASEIAAKFNVTVGTVYNAIHKTLEYDNPVYKILLEANESYGYTQAVVTRAYMAIRRWYPNVQTLEDMAKLSVGSDVDNNVHITIACEKIIEEACELAREKEAV